jgi:hypothetical protein
LASRRAAFSALGLEMLIIYVRIYSGPGRRQAGGGHGKKVA